MSVAAAAPVAAQPELGAARPKRQRPARVGAVPSTATGRVILIVTGVLFLVPLLAMVLFTFRVVGSKTAFTFDHYAAVVNPANELTYDGLFQGILNSLGICVITVLIVLVLLLPTMLLVELRYPKLRGLLEFICIIPITIPSIVLVVGFVPVYRIVSQIFGSSPWTLAFAIGIIVLPYAFRPIAANLAGVEVGILSEAGRSLGANWALVLWRVILPNLRRGILSACFITIAVVLGEFTIASFLSQNTFQTALLLLQQTDPYVGAISAVVALVFAFVLLLIIGRVGSFRRDRKEP
jgi:putative spermidine/putrescine transport system permease protein